MKSMGTAVLPDLRPPSGCSGGLHILSSAAPIRGLGQLVLPPVGGSQVIPSEKQKRCHLLIVRSK